MTGTGVEMIKMFEDLRLKPYQDSVGVWTIGWGHTGTDVTLYDGEIPIQRAEELLAEDIKNVEDNISLLLAASISPAQQDALVSFAFNLGAGALKKSTLADMHLDHNPDAFKEFRRWIYAGGKMLRGLYRRRLVESLRYLGADMETLSYVWRHGA